METIALGDPGAVERAAKVLRAGGVVLYPTDTVYGLGADALSRDAVRKIFSLKGRSAGNPISVVVEDLQSAEAFVAINSAAKKLAEAFWPGPLTIVLRKREVVPNELSGGRETLGIRVPNNSFCRLLAEEFGRPFTTTSANKAGAGECRSVDDVQASLGGNFDAIDLVVDGGQLMSTAPSTVVNVSGATPLILREGAIPSAHVLGVLSD